jgi:hypothetical protein
MGEKEEGRTGLRSIMGEEDVGLANEAEQRFDINKGDRSTGGEGMCRGVVRR